MPRPVATITLTFILALAGKLMLKDRLTRTDRWHDRMEHMGMGLTGRTLRTVPAGADCPGNPDYTAGPVHSLVLVRPAICCGVRSVAVPRPIPRRTL